ncbi:MULTISPECIES: hypothetical protein [unclassified Blastococcus]
MAGRQRNRARPPRAAAERARRLHAEQVRGHRFVAGWGPKRSATVVPAPLRYWQYRPGGPYAAGAAVLVVVLWLGLFGWLAGSDAVRDELPLALVAGIAVYVLNARRVTVTDHGLSFDVAGSRTDPAAVIPSTLVQAVHVGRAPADWPRPEKRGGWLPGRSRVAVRYLDDDGERALSLWVRDPAAFADSLGVPLTG